jgi:hypothetical protein
MDSNLNHLLPTGSTGLLGFLHSPFPEETGNIQSASQNKNLLNNTTKP